MSVWTRRYGRRRHFVRRLTLYGEAQKDNNRRLAAAGSSNRDENGEATEAAKFRVAFL
jgi:hypothetical protein